MEGQPEYLANGILVHNCIQAFWLHSTPHVANARHWAVSADLENLTRDPARKRPERMTPRELEDQQERDRSWGLDSFAPQDDDRRPGRSNVHAWH